MFTNWGDAVKKTSITPIIGIGPESNHGKKNKLKDLLQYAAGYFQKCQGHENQGKTK